MLLVREFYTFQGLSLGHHLTWGLETESHIAGATQQLLLGDTGLDLAV